MYTINSFLKHIGKEVLIFGERFGIQIEDTDWRDLTKIIIYNDRVTVYLYWHKRFNDIYETKAITNIKNVMIRKCLQ